MVRGAETTVLRPLEERRSVRAQGRGVALEQPGLVSEDHSLGPVPETELGEDVRDVRLDRRLADPQLYGGPSIRQPPADEPEDVELACCELSDLAGRRTVRRRAGGIADRPFHVHHP